MTLRLLIYKGHNYFTDIEDTYFKQQTWIFIS